MFQTHNSYFSDVNKLKLPTDEILRRNRILIKWSLFSQSCKFPPEANSTNKRCQSLVFCSVTNYHFNIRKQRKNTYMSVKTCDETELSYSMFTQEWMEMANKKKSIAMISDFCHLRTLLHLYMWKIFSCYIKYNAQNIRYLVIWLNFRQYAQKSLYFKRDLRIFHFRIVLLLLNGKSKKILSLEIQLFKPFKNLFHVFFYYSRISIIILMLIITVTDRARF